MQYETKMQHYFDVFYDFPMKSSSLPSGRSSFDLTRVEVEALQVFKLREDHHQWIIRFLVRMSEGVRTNLRMIIWSNRTEDTISLHFSEK